MVSEDYVIRVRTDFATVDAWAWDALLAQQDLPTPFMRHAYLHAMHSSGSASRATGWEPHAITIERGGMLVAGCVVYRKAHSYGEYVFDWAWANAFAQHGLDYYPKALVAVPFTPVPGSRLLAVSDDLRDLLVQTLLHWCREQSLSSLHLLFAADQDLDACARAGLMQRHTVQFHWTNSTPVYADYDDFLASLNQEKRKKIRQEQRKVIQAGVSFRSLHGREIRRENWDFFYRCYERTYFEHGNAPYLSRVFFEQIAEQMPDNWLLFLAEREGKPVASSLIALNAHSTGAEGEMELSARKVAYGRYWGSVEKIDCLHFDACYYQPLQWCIAHGFARFEGGAQGEHKMARALMPVKTSSAHWLAHPAFSDAVGDFLAREGKGIENYMEVLGRRTPFRHAQDPN